jgi:hypothetical protein
MKQLTFFIAVCFVCFSLFSCKKTGVQKTNTTITGSIDVSHTEGEQEYTFKDVLLLTYNYDNSVYIAQELSNGNYLFLHRYDIPGTEYNLYALIENAPGNVFPVNHTYIISLEAITEADLEEFPRETGKIYRYANGNFEGGGNEKIKVKYNNEINDLDAPQKRDVDASPEQDCYNYYWVTYIVETGEILSEEFLFTICETTNSGGGGGGGGNNGNDGGDEDDDEEEDALMSKPVEWTVSHYANYWTLNSIEKISGVKKASEKQGGHFTDIEHQNEYFFFGGQNWTWQKLSVVGSVDKPQVVSMYLYGLIKAKPNSPYPIGYEEPCDGANSWQFKDVF